MTDDIWSYLWGKLAYGSMLFAQALGEASIADCLARPELLPLWRSLGREVLEVARAEKVTPRGFNGFDPEAFKPGASEAQARESVDAMVAFNGPMREYSILQAFAGSCDPEASNRSRRSDRPDR